MSYEYFTRLTFWHRSFTFNSNKSPTWCNNFSVYYPDVYLQLNMFRAFSRPSSGAQLLQWQPLVLPSYRGDSRAVFVVRPAGPWWQIPDAVDTVVCAPDDGWWYHPKHVEQFPDINKLCNVASYWMYITILLWCTDPWTLNSSWTNNSAVRM